MLHCDLTIVRPPSTSGAYGFAPRLMPKPRFYIRHLCRTYYLSEWWDE